MTTTETPPPAASTPAAPDPAAFWSGGDWAPEEPIVDDDNAWKVVGGAAAALGVVAGGIWLIPIIGATGVVVGVVSISSAGYMIYRRARHGTRGGGLLPGLRSSRRIGGLGLGSGGSSRSLWPRGRRGGGLGRGLGLGQGRDGAGRWMGRGRSRRGAVLGADGLPVAGGGRRSRATTLKSGGGAARTRSPGGAKSKGSSWRGGSQAGSSARAVKAARAHARRHGRDGLGAWELFKVGFRDGAQRWADRAADKNAQRAEGRFHDGKDPNPGFLRWKWQGLLEKVAGWVWAPEDDDADDETQQGQDAQATEGKKAETKDDEATKKGVTDETEPRPSRRKPSPKRAASHSTMDQDPWVDPPRPFSRTGPLLIEDEEKAAALAAAMNAPTVELPQVTRTPVAPVAAAAPAQPKPTSQEDDEADSDFGQKTPYIPPQHRLENNVSAHPEGFTVGAGLLANLKEAHQNLFGVYPQLLESPGVDAIVDMDAFVRQLADIYQDFARHILIFANWIDAEYPAPGLGDYFRNVGATQSATGEAAVTAADAARGGFNKFDWERRTDARPGEVKANVPA